MSELEILTQFKLSLLTFFQELIDQFPLEGDLVIIHIFLDNQFPIKNTMEVFCLKLNKNDQELKKMIKARDEKFFLNHNLFDNFGEGKVSHFKKLWTSGVLDKENKDVVWSWVDTFVILSDRYLSTK
jgi:hypothetical protein